MFKKDNIFEASNAQKVSLWRVKSSGVRHSKIYKSLLGSKGLNDRRTDVHVY